MLPALLEEGLSPCCDADTNVSKYSHRSNLGRSHAWVILVFRYIGSQWTTLFVDHSKVLHFNCFPSTDSESLFSVFVL